MALFSGTKLGPYEIVAPLGAGGMGEVYRARDTRLDRTVAIKILPPQLSSDPVRKQRFEREAKTISTLNHPHICVLHDVGSQNGIDYLVMECIEGETLAKRLEKGPLALEQVLKFGAQIADALDKAHRSGVVHRDLKPGNIMLTPSGAKLLDFGLAKPTVPLVNGATLTTAATQTAPVTQEGMVVGTFQYMSPEQVESKEVDGRSDIFSLGAVLYEMVAGKCAFEGKSQLSVASAILEKDPAPVTAAKPTAPPALDYTIRKCLAKSPDDRWQSAADIKHQLDWIAQSAADSSAAFAVVRKKARWKPMVWVALGTLTVLAVGALAGYLSSSREVSGPVVRATITPLSNVTLLTLGDEAGAPAISPDGKNLVFVGLAGVKQMLFLRSMDTGAVKPLSGTEYGKFPFWSSDGKSIGFFAEQRVKRVDLAGGPPMSLAPAADARGGNVPASGGKPVAVTVLDHSLHTTHRWPRFLPDGKHFLYLAANHEKGKEANSGIYVGSIDGGTPKLILHANGSVVYASGELLDFRDGSLMAQEFDADRLELKGDAMPIAPVLYDTGNWGVIASASQNGVLVFESPGDVEYPNAWFDRSGRRLGLAPLDGELQDLRLSAEGTRAAAARFEGPSGYIYVADLKTGARTRLTFAGQAWFLALSPDGSRVVYSMQVANSDNTELYIKRTDGSGANELLLSSGNTDHPTDWTRDGKYIVINRGPLGAQQIWIMPMFGDRKPFRLLPNATYDHSDGRVSPDGKWIAYLGSESGRGEVYITSFPGGSGQWQVSSSGIVPAPAWQADGKELYFVALDGNMVAASIQESADSVTIQDVKPLFHSPFLASVQRTIFDVDPKGQRFIGTAAADTSALPLNVITNWTAELKKK
jgi:eukaryotic-like serine/threonine-protein kinase